MPTLTIIETGQAPKAIRDHWPSYPTMFEGLLAPYLTDWSFETIALSRGATLPNPAELDATLITGSPAGVYDDDPWMSSLMDFIRWSAHAKTPQIGICFGHQAIAHALGATVRKSDKGWGIGRHTYQVDAPLPAMGPDVPPHFSLGVSHQDQVESLPPGATVLASSALCNFAGLAYPAIGAISFQGHPEFSPEFNCALYNIRRGTALSDTEVDAAEQSFSKPVDNALVGAWLGAFLEHNQTAQR